MPARDPRMGRFISGGSAAGGRDIAVEVRGLQEAQKKVDQVITDLHGRPMLDGMRQATMLVLRDARINAPVDEGTLRGSLTPTVQLRGRDTVGIVGTKLLYAPYQELGTGVFVGRSPHYPPAAALEVWARRHGTTGYMVARAIGRRGGLKPKKFLARALETNQEKIYALLGETVSKIVRK